MRAFFPKDGVLVEDPVTALGRSGRVHVSRDGDGTIWVGGGTVTCVSGSVEL